MRSTTFWLLALAALAALVTAEFDEENWVEEEDVEEPYEEEEKEESFSRRRREVYVEDPYEEHVRVKRRCNEEPEYRVRRSADQGRVPRQVHQYEVYEFSDDTAPSSAPYDEMLAASANHYHRVYAAPARASARYFNPEVSDPIPVSVVSHPVQFVAPSNHPKAVFHEQFVAPPNAVNVPSVSVANTVLSPVGAVPLKQLSDGDLLSAAAGHHNKHHFGHHLGGGHEGHADHHAAHGGKGSKGYSSSHHLDKGAKGFKTNHNHRKEYEDAQGKKRKHHDHADHKGDHEEEAHGQRGAKFDEKKAHKKGHKTKGFHNKYHKDEYHKEHKFYDDFHKSGEHHRYGKFHAKHASNESGKKKAHHVNAGHDVMERGKKGYSNKGHTDADHKGYKGKDGHEEHHENHSQHGHKGGKDDSSHWGYAKNK